MNPNEHEEIVQKIRQFQEDKITEQELLNIINQYFENAPTKITINDNTIHLQMQENNYTNITMEKLEKLLYHLHDGNIVIPITS